MQVIPSSPSLPANLTDLSKFVLVGREKLTAVRAEIRAIDKLQLAQSVRDQKSEEARMLSEALLDAEVKLGEMTKNIPKATQGNQYTGKMVADSTVADQRPKHEVIRDLGFTPKQVERFEKLADNQDLVELAKAQARENDDIPTRTQVLTMAEARQRRFDNDMHRIDSDYETVRALGNALSAVCGLNDSTDGALSAVRGMDQNMEYYLDKLNEAIAKLTNIQRNILLKKGEAVHGKK